MKKSHWGGAVWLLDSSPVGSKYFYTKKRISFTRLRPPVSVPYGDQAFLYRSEYELFERRMGFRPLWGLSISIPQKEARYEEKAHWFPSPVGIKYFYTGENVWTNCYKCFRPLWGSSISIPVLVVYASTVSGFRPLWGSSISILTRWEIYAGRPNEFPSPMGIKHFYTINMPTGIGQISFRPLWGSSISIRC